MSIIVIPEFILHKTLSDALRFLREDYQNQSSDTDNSYLVKLVKELGFEKYNYKNQALGVFLANNEDPRHLTVDLGFNMTRESPPSIHITMPSETPGQNSLGSGEDSNNQFINSIEVDGELIPQSVQSMFQRRYRATYDIVIVSDNSDEVVMIYHIIKSLLVALSAHLTLSGLENLTFGGQDLQPYAELVPKNIFMRAVRLGIEYESSALGFEKNLIIQDIVFSNKVVSG